MLAVLRLIVIQRIGRLQQTSLSLLLKLLALNFSFCIFWKQEPDETAKHASFNTLARLTEIEMS